jgi:uncharacterized heparinase superfamily protein
LKGPRDFLFLSQPGTLDEIGWDGPQSEKLWRYNQHYFDDLNAESAVERTDWHLALIKDWVARNLPGKGTGWEPYPTSLRIVNWTKWALAGNQLPTDAVQSLALQARWLRRRVEWHLLGNHLFANAKALIFAGSLFTGSEADDWRAFGAAILAREFSEQILGDGGHFELSTMYHVLALEDVLDLVNLARARGEIDARAEAVVPTMLNWLRVMCHPDGEIAFFNDAAFAVAPSPAAIFAYALRLGFPTPATPGALTWLAESGYARLASGSAVLLADLARIGPDYLPGHAHADTLSFELSVAGQRVFVNGGTSVYGTGPERLRQRGTAAHNTVTVAGEDSSEVWGGFRVARRGRPFNVSVKEGTDGSLTAHGEHDGYVRLSGGPVHSRDWHFSPYGLTVEDRLTTDHPAEARYLLAPGIDAEAAAPTNGTISRPGGPRIRWQASGAVRIEPASWHPEFGQSRPASCLVLPLSGKLARMTLDWS